MVTLRLSRVCVSCVAAVLVFAPGCVVGVAWLPDSSGFVFTTPKGHLVAYDIATKKQRVILEDRAAAHTCWPAISADGKRIALAQFAGQDGQAATLEIGVWDLQGKLETRSPKIKWANLSGKDYDFFTQLFWSPDGKKLIVHGQGSPNQGKGFDHTALYDLADKKARLWENHVPAVFGASPIRPDGKGFLLLSIIDNEAGDYAWVAWDGAHKKVRQKSERSEDGPPLWSALYESRWDGARAIVTMGPERYIIDTQEFEERIEPTKPAEVMLGKEAIRARTQLANGVEILLLEHDDGDKSGPAMRVVARRKGDATLAQLVPVTRDRLILLSLSPDRKHAMVRIWYGPRGRKGDTVYVIGNAGEVVGRIDVYSEYVKK